MRGSCRARWALSPSTSQQWNTTRSISRLSRASLSHHNSPASTPGSCQHVGEPEESVARLKTECIARGPQIAKIWTFSSKNVFLMNWVQNITTLGLVAERKTTITATTVNRCSPHMRSPLSKLFQRNIYQCDNITNLWPPTRSWISSRYLDRGSHAQTCLDNNGGGCKRVWTAVCR